MGYFWGSGRVQKLFWVSSYRLIDFVISALSCSLCGGGCGVGWWMVGVAGGSQRCNGSIGLQQEKLASLKKIVMLD